MLDQPPDRMALYDHYLKYTDDEVLLHLIGNVETAKATMATQKKAAEEAPAKPAAPSEDPGASKKFDPLKPDEIE